MTTTHRHNLKTSRATLFNNERYTLNLVICKWEAALSHLPVVDRYKRRSKLRKTCDIYPGGPFVYSVPNKACTDFFFPESGQCLILGHHTPYKAGALYVLPVWGNDHYTQTQP